ncbi:7904_t:CDS:1 [Funneliformis mosseae]|uniref:7904_t:CDS:1 n=1 Tax=Funneliformis mosseae TaxID=27381 RepID=A0A9N8YR30_FUNMO|nr:7904_t:CDS:1 [Funneliformis mosseae]
MHVVEKNSYSRVRSYQKIAPNIKVEDSSCLMKINYLLNSPIDSPSSSTFRLLHSPSSVQKTKISKIKRFDKPVSERKRKSNSLARVMQDRGLLESTLNITSTTFTETKSVLFSNSPIMEIGELKKNIEDLNIDMSSLDNANINIKWKGQPLNIHHLTHYPWLHPKEAHVTSILRLTPVQYLTSKYILISSARRYVEKNLPFRKSDAQKLLRIDVNKASKLWEFFQQIKWI